MPTSKKEKKRKVPVRIDIDYNNSEVISLQLWINGKEQKLGENPLRLELLTETIYYLRWYIAGENGAEVVFNLIVPDDVQLRFPFVPVDKVSPQIKASIGNHPLIKDTSDDQRFYLLEKKEEK